MNLTIRSFPFLAKAAALALSAVICIRASAGGDAIYSYKDGQKITLTDTGLKSPDGQTLYQQSVESAITRDTVTGAVDSTLLELTPKFMVHVGAGTDIDALTQSWALNRINR